MINLMASEMNTGLLFPCPSSTGILVDYRCELENSGVDTLLDPANGLDVFIWNSLISFDQLLKCIGCLICNDNASVMG